MVFCPISSFLRKAGAAAAALLLLMGLSACQSTKGPPERGDFQFDLPQGFSISDVADKTCAIVNGDGVAVGGFILTGLQVKDMQKSAEHVPLIQYLDAIAERSEFFSWQEGDDAHPIKYLTQSVPTSGDSLKEQYYRVFFVKDSGVYDMWFNLDLIDKEAVSDFHFIAEESR